MPDQAPPRPRLLLVDNSLQTTGAFVSAMVMADLLAPHFEFEVLLSDRSELKPLVQARGLTCHTLPMRELGKSLPRLLAYLPFLLLNTLRLRRLLRERQIDVLVMNDYYNLLGAMACLTGWSGVLFTWVRLMPHAQHRQLNKLWIALGFRCSQAVLAVSSAVARQLPPGPKLHKLYIPSGFLSETEPDNSVRSDQEVRLLYLSNYIAGKGLPQALAAFTSAFRRNTALRLRFVGGDMALEKNRQLRSNMEARASELGLAGMVSFADATPRPADEIQRCDILLNFSESESFSATCFEASALGRPVIATRCGGPEEIILDGRTGMLVDVNNVEQMANAIVELSNSAEQRTRMGAAGRTHVTEKFSGEAFRARFVALVMQATKGGPAC
ncbi:MAG: glycosyltransferase family 4 protein [Pseudomonadota bacterium]